MGIYELTEPDGNCAASAARILRSALPLSEFSPMYWLLISLRLDPFDFDVVAEDDDVRAECDAVADNWYLSRNALFLTACVALH